MGCSCGRAVLVISEVTVVPLTFKKKMKMKLKPSQTFVCEFLLLDHLSSDTNDMALFWVYVGGCRFEIAN